MMKYTVILATFCATPTVWAGVVINEIFYNAPDDLEDLQWIEFYNDGGGPVDLSDWKLDGGGVFVFPAATKIGAHEYLVTALSPDRFTESYGGRAIGPLKRPLKRGGERIELADGARTPIRGRSARTAIRHRSNGFAHPLRATSPRTGRPPPFRPSIQSQTERRVDRT
jgi:hypothetical protein